MHRSVTLLHGIVVFPRNAISKQRSLKQVCCGLLNQLPYNQQKTFVDHHNLPFSQPHSSPTKIFARGFKTSSVLLSSHSASKPNASGIIQYNLADVGEGISECEILKWHVKEGDPIKEFDRLCDVQSDKSTAEISSRFDGVVKKVHYKVGQMAKVGSPLVDILLDSHSASKNTKTETETPKTHQHHQQEYKESSEFFSDEQTIHTAKHGPLKVLATPAVRNLARVNSLNLSKVPGSGKDGRVLKEDILTFLSSPKQTTHPTQHHEKESTEPSHKPQTQTHTPTPTTTPSSTTQKSIQVVPLSGIKRVMARTMTAATVVPHFGYYEEYNVDSLIQLRAQLKPIAESKGIKLSYLPIIIKATSLALNKYPILNSSVNAELTEVHYKPFHNIGIAVDTIHGLLVPNIKDVQDKSVFEIAQELNRLTKEAQENKLSSADLHGGTLTLSNIGTIGGTYASPVLLLPEVAIGAIGRIQKVARFDPKGNVVPVHIMNISWSADHRVIDGATMANFSNVLKSYLEHPSSMLFDLK